jgi:two-component system, sensor histidine kinase and response regulator
VIAPVLDSTVLDTLRQLNQPGEPDIVREVLTVFLADAPVRLARMREALARGDAASLERAAHTLKGAAASIGAAALQISCRELEEAGKVAALDNAPHLFNRVESEFSRLKAEVDGLLA